eukprot:PITA_19839
MHRQLVGSLMYLVNTRLDLCYAVNRLSQAMVQPTKMFWKAAKHVLRYLRGTSQYGLWYRWTEGVKLQGFTDADWTTSPSDRKSTSRGIFNLGSVVVSWYNKKQRGTSQYGLWYRWTEGVKLQGFIDADWAQSPSDRKSTSGGIFNLGSVVVSWYNKKQRSVALSSVEAKYMDASQVACEAIWMWKILVGLFDQRMDPTLIYCDNQNCIKLYENPVFHDRSKHIEIQYHHLRDCVARWIMLL